MLCRLTVATFSCGSIVTGSRRKKSVSPVPPGESLGGMSGGPVMLFVQESPPLVGVISEMTGLTDTVFVSAAWRLRIPATRGSVSPP